MTVLFRTDYANLRIILYQIMKTKLKNIYLITFVIFSISLFLSINAGERYSFIGVQKCKKCHEAESIGNQYLIWLKSPHSKAVLLLNTKRGMEIGETQGVENPAEDLKCLKCHTTGGGKTKATRKEGVGCEACHGPGEKYHEYNNHVDVINRKRAYEIAQGYGMYPTLGTSNIKKREKLCRYCHNNSRPCLPEDPEEQFNQKITLQTISTMRKGQIILKHPLIPPFPQY